MREVATGIWHWEAPHPEWSGPENESIRRRLTALPEGPNEAARGVVSSYAVDHGGRLLLFDPIQLPAEIEKLAADREPVIVLTCPWHERDTRSLVERLDATVYAPPPDDGAGDLAWLFRKGTCNAHVYTAGDRLPIGAEALPGRLPNDLVVWVESTRVAIAGDTLVNFGRGLEIAEWLERGATREQVVDGLRPLLERPVGMVLATHGGPTDRAGLEHALGLSPRGSSRRRRSS